MSGSSSTLSGLHGGQQEVEKDHDIQCDDVTELVSVSEFKERCRELHREIFEDHVMEVSGTEAERQQIEEESVIVGPIFICNLNLFLYAHIAAQPRLW